MIKYEELLKLCQKLIINGVGKGIDEVGTRFCGTAWPQVKKLFTPVVDKLRERYPDLFQDTREAELAANALLGDPELQQLIVYGFDHLLDGQDEILELLARQDMVLKSMKAAVDDGFGQMGDNQAEMMRIMKNGFRELHLKLSEMENPRGESKPSSNKYMNLSSSEIHSTARQNQADAMKWLTSGDINAASKRLLEAREMLLVGIDSEPENNELLVAFGFIEKTQAQIARAKGDVDGYVKSFSEAAMYFGKVLANDPTDAGAINGMVNVYISNKDYDSAVKMGKYATIIAPEYGAAYWDLAIAYEGMLKTSGSNRELILDLITVYDRLLSIMPKESTTFSAKDLVHVQNRLADLKNG